MPAESARLCRQLFEASFKSGAMKAACLHAPSCIAIAPLLRRLDPWLVESSDDPVPRDRRLRGRRTFLLSGGKHIVGADLKCVSTGTLCSKLH